MPKQIFPRGCCIDSFDLTSAKEYLAFSDHDDQQGERFNVKSETELLKWIFNHPINLMMIYLFLKG